ncbi:CLUMA_CG000053, isoform A [Clunio marinus]|uniref:Trans-1,2-dihydrobenzene-1,2-diol dehydrogenase n=1 Tax=Clunio marinus TaxID=568069 RepID=A0A1J1HEL7_9DIPT|nr:CLUMA_CG000053, isoform A [Clunio marinus]
MAPLRWGIASAGKISNDFCAALTTLPKGHHELVAVAARSEENAKEFAKLFNIPNYYGGYEMLMKDPNVDIVYVGAINTTHLEIGLMALDNGKHILCEKPLTLNEKHSRKLLEKAKEMKLFCMEGIWSRFFPSYKYLKKRLDDGDFGDIKEVNAEFGFNISNVDRLTKKDLGGGVILDLGVYAIQFAQFVFRSEPTSIIAKGKLNDEGVDAEVEIELKYSNGGIARLKTSAVRELHNEGIVKGTKGSMKLHNFWCCTHLTDIDTNVKEWPLPKPKIGEFIFTNSAGLRYEAEEIRNCINNGLLECPIVSHDESLLIAHIEDEIRHISKNIIMAPLRWGIASTGTISFDFANALSTLPVTDHQIVAVGARSLSSAKVFAKKFDVPKYYEGYENLMKDEEIDVIYIGSIVATHFEIAMLALQHNKHVLCEKPLTLNEKMSRRLFATAKEKNLFFMEGLWSRFFESWKYLRQRIDDGDLGEIKEIDLEFGFPLADTTRLFLNNGGGSTLDLGVYPIQLSLWVFRAEPTKVIAFSKLNEDSLDMEYNGEYHFPNGGITKFKVSCLSPLSNTAIIKGTKGEIVLPDFWCPLKLTDVDGSIKSWDLPKARYDFLLKNSAGLSFEAEEARRLINDGLIESPSVTHEESLRLARVQDKQRKLFGVHFPEDDLEY